MSEQFKVGTRVRLTEEAVRYRVRTPMERQRRADWVGTITGRNWMGAWRVHWDHRKSVDYRYAQDLVEIGSAK